jgi:hypothetical protein
MMTKSEKAERNRVDVHLIDGTYELFRHFYAVPASADVNGQEVGAVRGVLTSVLSMIERGATHLGVATDHAVEPFRNDLYPGYKTSEGVPQELLSQFPSLEDALQAMGVVVWPMVEFEADDALASAAAKSAKDDRAGRVLICTPDKDLSQCVVGTRVVQLDHRRDILRDEAGVVAKFGVRPCQFRITWEWSAIVQMTSRVCLDGAKRLLLLPYLSTPTWKIFRKIGENGILRSEKPARCRNRFIPLRGDPGDLRAPAEGQTRMTQRILHKGLSRG